MTGIWFAIGSMLLAALAVVLAKFGVKSAEAEAGVFIRTLVLAVAFWGVVFATGSVSDIKEIAPMTFLYILISGIGWGLSHIFYFKALKKGAASKVVAVTHISVVFTAMLRVIFYGTSGHDTLSAIALCLVAIGVIFITYKGKAEVLEIIETIILVFSAFLIYYYFGDKISLTVKIIAAVIITAAAIFFIVNLIRHHTGGIWLLFSVISAIFAAGTTLFCDTNIGTDSSIYDALRILIVLLVCLIALSVTGKWGKLKAVKGDSLFFLILSGITLAASRYFLSGSISLGYSYLANILAQVGIMVTVLLCMLFLKDKITVRSGLGELLITAGYILMVI
ncbi:MAG: EamA family transporter [Oscillospiraceae bacterium]|nr:EamA family transporter [Oscillospiraceae bacterium]